MCQQELVRLLTELLEAERAGVNAIAKALSRIEDPRTRKALLELQHSFHRNFEACDAALKSLTV
jgi:hypothetical protein